MTSDQRLQTVAALGTTQLLAWASSYYLAAILAAPMARDLQVAQATVFAAVSAALAVSGLLGPFAGRWIDRYGGRPVLISTNLVFAAGLAALAMVRGPAGLFAAWLVIGLGMGAGLYEAAFATLVRLYGRDARGAITGITLIAGFASTVGWPLSAWLEAGVGWRGTCLAWAALHLGLGVPLNALLAKPAMAASRDDAPPATGDPPHAESAGAGARLSTGILLAIVFAITWFIGTAMAVHLPRLLQIAGVTAAKAVGCSALVGPAQVAARLLEAGLMRRFHPLLSARLAALAHPIGAALLILAGAPLAAAFAILHGAGTGILSVALGTLPLALFGPRGYGARQGLLMLPARIALAVSPFTFELLIDRWGASALWWSALLGLGAFGALLSLSRRTA